MTINYLLSFSKFPANLQLHINTISMIKTLLGPLINLKKAHVLTSLETVINEGRKNSPPVTS